MIEDKEIIALFFARSERAVQELDKKYGGRCHKLSRGITGNISDAEECINDAYLGVWNKIPPENPENLLAYLLKIVRNLSLKRYRQNAALKRAGNYEVALCELGECLPAAEDTQGAYEGKEMISLIEEFLDALSKENRVIFMRRYWFGDSCGEIAKKAGISEKNVTVRLTRIRAKLKKYLSERGIAL